MRNRLEDAKSDLLTEAAGVVEHHRGAQPPPGREDAEALLRRYYRHVAPEDLVGRDPVDVYGAAMSQRQLAEQRPQGTANVRAYVPTPDEHGWASGHTVVEVVTDDMPFLVDSVTMELSRQDRGIHLVVHPQLVVCRDVSGRLLEVCDLSGADLPSADHDDAVVESWMHVEIDRESDPGALRAIEQDLQRVLRDVRETVEDWDKMRQRALDLADEIAATAFPLPAEEISEAEELLRWLADDHFTFLGYREYTLESVDGEDALRAVTGSGLGILRSDQELSDSFAKLPPAVRSRAREKRLLVLTKANSRATVHRPTYLDYVGVKAFDQTGEVVGERRFLGLLSSAAYTESVLRIPVLRRKVVAVLAKAGFTPTSPSGRTCSRSSRRPRATSCSRFPPRT